MKNIYLIIGQVTCLDAYDGENVKLGQPEYQFSDAPSGERSRSSDYIDLEKGLKEHKGFHIIYE